MVESVHREHLVDIESAKQRFDVPGSPLKTPDSGFTRGVEPRSHAHDDADDFGSVEAISPMGVRRRIDDVFSGEVLVFPGIRETVGVAIDIRIQRGGRVRISIKPFCRVSDPSVAGAVATIPPIDPWFVRLPTAALPKPESIWASANPAKAQRKKRSP